MVERMCKVVVLGDSGVGKSTVIHQFINQEFRADFKPTIGADFSCKTCKVQNKDVQLQIWDTAGGERFDSLSEVFFRGADACILVYDRTSRESLVSLHKWRDEFIKKVPNAADQSYPFVIFANKSDLDIGGNVPKSDAEDMFKGCPVVELSGKNGDNVFDGFLKVAELYLTSSRMPILEPPGVQLNDNNGQKKCC